jgi:hypothetical protein
LYLPEVVANEHPKFYESFCFSLRSGRSILQLPAAGKIGACSDFPRQASIKVLGAIV